MKIVFDDDDIVEMFSYVKNLNNYSIFIDKYIVGKEIEVDVIFDGEDILIFGIMEYIERVGVYLGDSILLYFVRNILKYIEEKIVEYIFKIVREFECKGFMNV